MSPASRVRARAMSMRWRASSSPPGASVARSGSATRRAGCASCSSCSGSRRRCRVRPHRYRPEIPSTSMDWKIPTLADVYEARRWIAPHLRPTPLYSYPGIDDLVGASAYVKHENHQPIGAFKVRGGINLVAQLRGDERAGVLTASTGNHGQSIAYAGRLFGVPAAVCVPEGANPVKVASMRGLGAEVIFHGSDFDDAREHCERLARERSWRYVHSANEPLLIAGVATQTLEILEERPSIDVVIVPLGGGSGAAGACIVAKAVDPRIQVIAVQSEQAPAGFRSWAEGQLVEDKTTTIAEGLATRTAFELPQQILRERLDDFLLVSDEEL